MTDINTQNCISEVEKKRNDLIKHINDRDIDEINSIIKEHGIYVTTDKAGEITGHRYFNLLESLIKRNVGDDDPFLTKALSIVSNNLQRSCLSR